MRPQEFQIGLEIRRIAAELDALPFVKRTWNWGLVKKDGNAAGGDADLVAGCGGAVVYHDIIGHGGHGSRAVVLNIADRVISRAALRTKNQRETADAIREVAFLRLTRAFAVSRPELPPDAGQYYHPRCGAVPLAKRHRRCRNETRKRYGCVVLDVPFTRSEFVALGDTWSQRFLDHAALAWCRGLAEEGRSL